MTGCIHRTVVCIGCGEAIVRCDCDGVRPQRMYQWCGKTETCIRPYGVSDEPIEAPPEGRQTTEAPPIEAFITMLFEMEDPDRVAEFLEGLAAICRRRGKLKLSGS